MVKKTHFTPEKHVLPQKWLKKQTPPTRAGMI